MSDPLDYERLELEPARRSRWWVPPLIVLAIPVAWILMWLVIMAVLILTGHRDWLDHLGH